MRQQFDKDDKPTMWLSELLREKANSYAITGIQDTGVAMRSQATRNIAPVVDAGLSTEIEPTEARDGLDAELAAEIAAAIAIVPTSDTAPATDLDPMVGIEPAAAALPATPPDSADRSAPTEPVIPSPSEAVAPAPRPDEDAISSVVDSVRSLREAMRPPASTATLVDLWPELTAAARKLMTVVESAPQVAAAIDPRADGGRRLPHHVHAAMIAMYAARRARRFDDRLDDLGAALFLHDLAPERAVNGVPAEAASLLADFAAWQADKAAAAPDSTSSQQLMRAACTFASGSCRAPWRQADGEARPLAAGLAACRKEVAVDLLKSIISFIGFYPVGCKGRLTNGEDARVVSQNIDNPLRPVVRTEGEGERIIDLGTTPQISFRRVSHASNSLEIP